MSQQHRIGRVATSVKGRMKNGLLSVVYHATEVVKVEDGFITLDHGGWLTTTTKTRMNQASNQFGLGFYVFQKAGEWFITLPTGKVIDFPEGYGMETLVSFPA